MRMRPKMNADRNGSPPGAKGKEQMYSTHGKKEKYMYTRQLTIRRNGRAITVAPISSGIRVYLFH
jgi:hypothetical protein